MAVHPRNPRRKTPKRNPTQIEILRQKTKYPFPNSNTGTIGKTHIFYPRVVNSNNITFCNTEMALLQEGPKYNIHVKNKNWVHNLALEAETAITLLPTNERETYRKIIADRIHALQQNNDLNPTHNTHPETKLINSIKSKLQKNNAIKTRADEGNSLVILPTQQYESKIQDVLQRNNFTVTTTDPTNTFQTEVDNTIKHSKMLIPRDRKWKYINLNPSAPSIKGLIKITQTGTAQ
jgi:hypothetical protein